MHWGSLLDKIRSRKHVNVAEILVTKKETAGKISKLCENSSGAVSEAIVVCIDGRLE